MAEHRTLADIDLDDQSWSKLAGILHGFEEAWRTTPYPDMRAFVLEPQHPLRERLLVELVKVDQELRWESGQPQTLEAYLDEWPELRTNEHAVAELLQSECITRGVLEMLPTSDELQRRFPDYYERIDLDAIAREVENDRAPAPHLKTQVCRDDSTIAPGGPPQVLQPGQQFGRYRIEEPLGQGAMGTVYRAYDQKLGRDVALKIPQLADPDMLRQFLREARAAAGLRHPNICPVYDVDEVGGIHFITMAMIEGELLTARIQSHQFAPVEAARLVQKLAGALSALHGTGTVHRDIKPSNVMIDASSEPVLMDFGLARTVLSEPDRTVLAATNTAAPNALGNLTHAGSFVGTPAYMSPELANGEPVDARNDVYALGVLLYELLTGRLPFSGLLDQLLRDIVQSEPPRPSALRPDVPPQLEAVCLRAMAKDPNNRYQSAAELAAALAEFSKQNVQRVHATRRRRWLAMCGAGALLAATVIVLRTGEGELHLDVPSGATVFIDGQPAAMAPGDGQVQLDIGEHRVLIKWEGQTVTDTLRISWRGQTVERSYDLSEPIVLLAEPKKWIEVPRAGAEGLSWMADGNAFLVPEATTPMRIVDRESGRVVRALQYEPPPPLKPDGKNPYVHKGSLLSPDGRYLYVTNYYAQSVSRIDLQHDDEVNHLDLGGEWGANIGITPDEKKLVVALGLDGRSLDKKNDQVAIIGVEEGEFDLLGKVTLDDEPESQGLGFSADSGYAYLVTSQRRSEAPTLYEIKLTAPYEVSRRLSFPATQRSLRGVAVSGKLQRAFVSDHDRRRIWVVDLNTFEVTGEFELYGYAPGPLALSADERLLYALCPGSGKLICLDAASGEKLGGASGLGQTAVSFGITGDHIFVAHGGDTLKIAILNRRELTYRAVFASNEGGEGYQLHVMVPGGSKLVRLTSARATHRAPRWSPDGRWIAFVSDVAGPDHVCLVRRDGSGLRVLEKTDPILGGQGEASLDWSPDGKQIAFVGDYHRAIRVVEVESGVVKTLKQGPIGRGYYQHNGLCWDWANDRIIFSSQDPATSLNQDLFVLNPASGELSQLTDEWDRESYCFDPSISPDGKHLATLRRERDQTLPCNIYLLNADGSGLRQLTHDDQRVQINPNWFPDGQRLIYSAGEHGHHQLFTINADGTNLKQLTDAEADHVEPDVWGR